MRTFHFSRPVGWLVRIIAFSLIATPLSASAQAPTPPAEPVPSVVVVPVATGSQESSAVIAEVRRRLTAATDTPFDTTAAATFESRHSAEAAAIAASDIERWASSSRAALRLLSRGDYDGARRALLQAQAISERAADALNRETVRARQVLDTCLFVVRASIETGDTQAAEAQARSCRRLVPRMTASAYTHTPEVRELVARIDAELDAESAGVLRVATDALGCIARINGVSFGPTPLVTSELPRGEYRVQVECDDAHPGRLHRVVLADADVDLVVRASFERAVHSRPELALSYDSAANAESRAESDGVAIARALGTRVVLVFPGATNWTFLSVDPNGRRPSTTRVDAADSTDANASIARVLGAARSVPVASTDPASDAHDDDRPRDAVSISLLTVGGAALATSIGLSILRSHRGDVMVATPSSSASYLANQDAYTHLRPVVLGTSIGGGLVASVATARMVRRAERPRLYAWIGGSVGLGLMAWATIDALQAPACFQRPFCTEHDAHLDRATLVGSLAAPALAMPIAAAIPTGRDVRVAVDVGPAVSMLTVRGSLR